MIHWMFKNWLWIEFMDKHVIFQHIVTKKIFWKTSFKFHSNTLKMIHWMFKNWLWIEFMDRHVIFQHILTKKIFWKNLLNFIPIPWKWSTECLKTECGQNLWLEIRFLKVSNYSSNMHNFNISICYKSRLFWSSNYKSHFSFCIIFSVVSPHCVSSLCLPVVFPCCVSPFLGRSHQASLSATWIYSSTIWDVTYPRNNFVLRCAPSFRNKAVRNAGTSDTPGIISLEKNSKKENTWKIKKDNFKTEKKTATKQMRKKRNATKGRMEKHEFVHLHFLSIYFVFSSCFFLPFILLSYFFAGCFYLSFFFKC